MLAFYFDVSSAGSKLIVTDVFLYRLQEPPLQERHLLALAGFAAFAARDATGLAALFIIFMRTKAPNLWPRFKPLSDTLLPFLRPKAALCIVPL